MNGNIYVNKEGLTNVINELSNLKKSLRKTFDNQINLAKEVNTYWSGTVGEEACKELLNRSTRYDNYIKQLEEKIKFLASVRDAYIKLDSDVSKKVDNNTKNNLA